MTRTARLRLALARLLWPQGFAPQGRHLHRDPPKGRRKARPELDPVTAYADDMGAPAVATCVVERPAA